MSAQKRFVSVALLSYRDADGLDRVALMGDEIELEGAELERAERLGAVSKDAVGAPAGPVGAPAPPVDPAEAGKLLELPAKPSRAAKADDSK